MGRVTRRGRVAAGLRSVAAVAVASAILVLAGCSGANAGSRASDDFAEYMAGVPGVIGVGGFISNNLPFLGSGDLTVDLDPSADEATIDAAVTRAGEFEPGMGVEIYTLTTLMPIDDETAPGAALSIQRPWSDPAEGVVAQLDDLRSIDGLAEYMEQRQPEYDAETVRPTVEVLIAEGINDPCAAVTEVLRVSPADAESFAPWQRMGDTRLPLECP
ncbi:hypothetical protein [Microbacterium sp. C7(2022)]|uniref:hypothetical protein n=1 Tax=Microbacterium sp. C7(2022) TaxID=2992759 RepID=UPI00237A10F2|nr:hypothetical protein [Microbacterium sp. C7(2022)]MDE0545202.1 hypothetical protein [Microbacterium sp. C7(2022)]